MNSIAHIQQFNAGRDPERLRLKYRAMRESTFAFLRGTCDVFYARLPRGGAVETAPAVWLCGDLHLENSGSYSADNHLANSTSTTSTSRCLRRRVGIWCAFSPA